MSLTLLPCNLLRKDITVSPGEQIAVLQNANKERRLHECLHDIDTIKNQEKRLMNRDIRIAAVKMQRLLKIISSTQTYSEKICKKKELKKLELEYQQNVQNVNKRLRKRAQSAPARYPSMNTRVTKADIERPKTAQMTKMRNHNDTSFSCTGKLQRRDYLAPTASPDTTSRGRKLGWSAVKSSCSEKQVDHVIPQHTTCLQRKDSKSMFIVQNNHTVNDFYIDRGTFTTVESTTSAFSNHTSTQSSSTFKIEKNVDKELLGNGYSSKFKNGLDISMVISVNVTKRQSKQQSSVSMSRDKRIIETKEHFRAKAEKKQKKIFNQSPTSAAKQKVSKLAKQAELSEGQVKSEPEKCFVKKITTKKCNGGDQLVQERNKNLKTVRTRINVLNNLLVKPKKSSKINTTHEESQETKSAILCRRESVEIGGKLCRAEWGLQQVKDSLSSTSLSEDVLYSETEEENVQEDIYKNMENCLYLRKP